MIPEACGMELRDAIDEVRRFLRARGLSVHETVAAPATSAEIAAVESALGVALPPPLVDIYSSLGGGFGFGWKDTARRLFGSLQLYSPSSLIELHEHNDPVRHVESYLRACGKSGRAVDAAEARALAFRDRAFLPLWHFKGPVFINCADHQGAVFVHRHLSFVEPERSTPTLLAPDILTFFLRCCAVSWQRPPEDQWRHLAAPDGSHWSLSRFDQEFVVPSLAHYLD